MTVVSSNCAQGTWHLASTNSFHSHVRPEGRPFLSPCALGKGEAQEGRGHRRVMAELALPLLTGPLAWLGDLYSRDPSRFSNSNSQNRPVSLC